MSPEDKFQYGSALGRIEDNEGVSSSLSPKAFIRRIKKEEKAKLFLMATVAVTVAILFFIILFTAYNSIDAIKEIGIWNFLTGNRWDPAYGIYGALPIITGTVLVTAGAILFALPIGLGMAIYINDVASPRVKAILKPACEVFAGIPSVVYGLIGLTLILPIMMDMFPDQLPYGSSWLAASLLLGIMALPTIISVSQDALAAVPRSYREASMAMGATKWETTRKVTIRAAISGISAAAILGVGRAMGETIAVAFVCGRTAVIPEPIWNVFSMIQTLPSAIVSGYGEAGHGGTEMSALFLLGLILLVMVLCVNLSAGRIVRRTKIKTGEIKRTKMEEMVNRLTSPFTMPLEKHKESMIQAFAYVTAFGLVAMMSSLFIGATGAIALGMLAGGTLFLSKRASRKIGPKHVQKIVYSSLGVVVIAIILVLAVFVGFIVMKGLPALSLDFILDPPSDMGRAGGIWPAIIGTLELMGGTALIAFPLGICSGIFFAEYAKDTKFVRISRQAIDALSGTPSIIFGLFGMSVFVIALGWGYSLIAGFITLSLMVLPTIIKTTEEAVKAVPNELREASAAMGSSKWHTTVKIVLPAAFGGVITGFLLSMIRAIGETAPILLTAVAAFKTTATFSLMEQIMALPAYIYHNALEVPGGTTNAYGAALVLMMIVMALFAVVTAIRRRQNKKFSGW